MAYMFGFSGSFTDSVVYFTPIQQVDSVWMDTKTKFLLGRDNYAYQLKNFFADNYGEPFRTCIVFYAWKEKDINKKYAKMKDRYTVKARNPYDVKFIEDFSFVSVDMAMEEYVEDEAGAPPSGGMGGPPSGGMGPR